MLRSKLHQHTQDRGCPVCFFYVQMVLRHRAASWRTERISNVYVNNFTSAAVAITETVTITNCTAAALQADMPMVPGNQVALPSWGCCQTAR
jgi:hypothetical protein